MAWKVIQSAFWTPFPNSGGLWAHYCCLYLIKLKASKCQLLNLNFTESHSGVYSMSLQYVIIFLQGFFWRFIFLLFSIWCSQFSLLYSSSDNVLCVSHPVYGSVCCLLLCWTIWYHRMFQQMITNKSYMKSSTSTVSATPPLVCVDSFILGPVHE